MKKIDIYEPYVLNFRCQKLRASILEKMAPNPCTCFVIGCHPPTPLLKLQPIEIKLLGAATLLPVRESFTDTSAELDFTTTTL
jgi:hypothetical protein